MSRNFAALHPKLFRALIAISALTMFVLSAGAPRGYGG